MSNIIKEWCIDSWKEISLCNKYNPERIELCSDLKNGGRTPSYLKTFFLLKTTSIDVIVMIRETKKGFLVNDKTLKKMIKKIIHFNKLNIKGFIFGVLNKDNTINMKAMQQLVKYVDQKKEIVFHMGFDQLIDKDLAINQLISLGVKRILTKGDISGPATNNINELNKLKNKTHNKIELVIGGSVTNENYQEIFLKTNINQFHGRKLH